MAKKIRVGVAGGAWVGYMHTGSLARVPGVELVAFADIDEKTRNSATKDFGFTQTFADYRDMIASSDIDAVIVALPTAMHYEASAAALRAGCHVLCEKPPMSTVNEMVKIRRLAEQKGLVYMFGRQSRFSAPVVAARKLVKRGGLGDVYHADASWIRARWYGLSEPSWRFDRRTGGGVLLDLGIHVIDEVWYSMGCPDPVEVTAGLHVGFRRFSTRPRSYTADDAAAGMIRFKDGATLSFAVSFALNTPGPVGSPEFKNGTPEWVSTRIYGTKGGLDIRNGLITAGGLGSTELRPLKLPDIPPDFEGQAREFVRAARRGNAVVSSADEAVTLMKILEAARRSGEQGRSIRIR